MTPVLCSDRMPPIVHPDWQESEDVLFLLADDHGRGPRWRFGCWSAKWQHWEDQATGVGDSPIYYEPGEVVKWCEPPPVAAVEPVPLDNSRDNAAAIELSAMLDALQRSNNVGLFQLGKYMAQKRLSNGYEVTFEVREPARVESESPEIVCQKCGACFECEDDYADIGAEAECLTCGATLTCQEKRTVWSWGVADTEPPPPAEKTNPVASAEPLVADEDAEELVG
jgi:hypothetical protein